MKHRAADVLFSTCKGTMMFGLERWLIGTAIVAAVCAGLFGWGYHTGWKSGFEAGFAENEAKWLAWQEKAQKESRDRERSLLERGEVLAAELEAARVNVQIKTVRVVRIVRQKASATAACFTPPVVQALNEGTPGASEEASGASSEAAVGQWAAEAREAHESCRAQIGALADYVRKITGDKL